MQQMQHSKPLIQRRTVSGRVGVWAVSLIAVLSAPTFATPLKGDTAFLAARDAFRAGESVRLAKSVDAMRGHPLQPWAEYWQLRLRLDEDATATNPAILAFLERHAGSYVADKLRGDWLRAIGKRGEWEVFNRELPALVQADDEVNCYAGQSTGNAAIARTLFVAGKDLPAACTTLVNGLVEASSLSVEEVWQRIRRQFEAKRVGAARSTAGYLPASEAWDAHARGLESIAQTPLRHLERLPADFATTRAGRETALFAVQRLARSDAATAASHLEKIETRLRPEERAYGWSQVAQWGAMVHRPEALAWFDKTEGTVLNEEAQAWRVRAALRTHDWTAVMHAIAAMSPALASQPDWVYWRARALQKLGQADVAQGLFQQISGQPNFYSNLADEELGRSIQVPPRALAPTKEELAAATGNPSLQRALNLIRLDMRVEGVREWVFALRGMDDRQLIAAASFAHSEEAWDRAINTADRTRLQHDYSLRYVAPFSDQVRPKAQQLALDDGWVYGLMRQESRFIMNAKSTVGAKGLMQLMPATAKWVAKKINLSGFHPNRVTEMDMNVTLGTHYMKMVLDSLDSHPVLASAAYNAGPSRAKRWRADRPLEGAIYAETIPFSETRDYVKKVMSNAVYYSALFEQRPQSLKARLGTVRARGEGERGVEELP
jgi:soluble lytic murein transglycosylase